MRVMWSTEMLCVLRECYADMSNKEIGKKLGIPHWKVAAKANSIGLRKSEAYLNSPASGRLTGQQGASFRFTKGMPGWNKGLKQRDYMSAESIERTAKTRFKKGQDPHNTVEIGHVRVTRDGYLEMKVRHEKGKFNKNFELLQRLVWEKYNGPIPENYIIEFIDGNPMNVSIENLRMSSRAENILRNLTSDQSIVKRFFRVKSKAEIERIIREIPEVIDLKRKIILLKHKLNQKHGKETSTI